MNKRKSMIQSKIKELDRKDIETIEIWYHLSGGNKKGLTAITNLLKYELPDELIYIKSVVPIDDVTFILFDINNKMTMISLVLNVREKSSIIITTEKEIQKITFTLKTHRLKDEITNIEKSEVSNYQLYREKYNELLYKLRKSLQQKKEMYRENKINLLKEIKELCINDFDYSALGEYCLEDTKTYKL